MRNKYKQTLAALYSNADGGALTICNNKMNNRTLVGLGTNEYGGMVRIDNIKGQAVANLGASTTGGLLGITNNMGKPVVAIGASPGGVLTISNKDGKPVVGIYADADGDGILKTSNNKGEVTSTTP